MILRTRLKTYAFIIVISRVYSKHFALFLLTNAGVKVFEDFDWKEHGQATAWQGVTRMNFCYEEILKKSKKSALCHLFLETVFRD
jgi:hypothetical protein